MNATKRIKPAVNVTLSVDVIEWIDREREKLGLSRAPFINMTLKNTMLYMAAHNKNNINSEKKNGRP